MPQPAPDTHPHAPTVNLRNEPVQARSAARLTRLLDSAAEVIDEIGYERLTTAMVAERAGASIGTVYRYFPDRIAVLQSLSVRFLSEAVEEVTAALTNGEVTDWKAGIDAFFDIAVASFRSKPGFRSLRFGDVIDVRPLEAERTNNAVIAEAITGVLAERFTVKADDLAPRMELAVQIIDSLLARAFVFDTAGDARIIDEARAIVHNYLGDAASGE